MKKSIFLKKLGLCALSAALCASAFASCGKDDGGDGSDGNKIDENTDVASVKSEQVADQTAWEAAFDVTKFTNFSMKTEETQTLNSKTTYDTLIFMFTGDKAYYSDRTKNSEGKTDRDDVYLAKTNEVWSAYGISYANGEMVYEGAYDMNNGGEYDYMITGGVGTAMLTQIGSIPFERFSYSEEKKGYVYAVEGEGEAVVKIVNGLFVGYTMSGETGEGEEKRTMEMSTIFYNVGSTVITLPEKMTTPADETMTKAEFFAELERRETASIAAKKWGTVNVTGTQTRNGVTSNVRESNVQISHGQGFSTVQLIISEGATGSSRTSVGVFNYSVMQNNPTNFSTVEYKKVGANLQAVWIATVDGETASMKVTLDADGYATEYEMNSERDGSSLSQKFTLAGYAGEYKLNEDSGKKPEEDNVGTITVAEFEKILRELQGAAPEYTNVSVVDKKYGKTYENVEIKDGWLTFGEGDDETTVPIDSSAVGMELKEEQNSGATVSIEKSANGYSFVCTFGDTVLKCEVNNEGYLTRWTMHGANDILEDLYFSNYKE